MTWDSEKNIFHTVEFTAVKCTVIMIVVDYEVNGVIAEQRFQKRCISLCDLDVNVREFFLKICDDRWQNITGEERAGAKRQTSGFQCSQIVDVIFHPLLNLENLFRSFYINFPDFCKLQWAGAAVEQRKPDFFLYFLYTGA